MKLRFLCIFILLAIFARADVMDDYSALRQRWDESLLDLYGNRFSEAQWLQLQQESNVFQKYLVSTESKELYPKTVSSFTPETAAVYAGEWQGNIQHILALELADRVKKGDVAEAKKWRALINLPKYADAVQGALALQSRASQRDEVAQLLSREYLVWQITLIREKVATLKSAIENQTTSPELIAVRTNEIRSLAAFPQALLQLARPDNTPIAAKGVSLEPLLALAAQPESDAFKTAFKQWQSDLFAQLPNLLSEEDITRRERLVLKLLRLVPIEYRSGVRDGQIIIPLEYREAQTFTQQCHQILDELEAPWKTKKTAALDAHGTKLHELLDSLATNIQQKVSPDQVENLSKQTSQLLESEFGLSLRRQGKASYVIAETLLDVRTLLKESLRAAQRGNWSEAESLRLDAYTNQDLEIESRVLPRDPQLALETEKSFLDGDKNQIGIKAALDARLSGEKLVAPYEKTLSQLDKCAAVLQVGLSPTTAIFTTVTIVTREGLEAVVILAALLAGMRGPENKRTRQRIGMGAWLAVVAAGITFVLSRYVVESLSHYGEKLEAVVSILAVFILLIVTNWVFHKAYWVGWNTRLRSLSKAVQTGNTSRWTGLAMVGVGFLTIYREGFETVLFLQSLLLEGGFRPVLIGLAIGSTIIATLGSLVFVIGSKLPYRKLLVYTGVLVVTILITFVGSTVRLFQTVGWMPINPITWLDIPSWMGIWLGIYPSWEGILIPPLGLAYVGGAWLFVKWQNRNNHAPVAEKPHENLAAGNVLQES